MTTKNPPPSPCNLKYRKNSCIDLKKVWKVLTFCFCFNNFLLFLSVVFVLCIFPTKSTSLWKWFVLICKLVQTADTIWTDRWMFWISLCFSGPQWMAPVGPRGFWLPDDVLGSQSNEIYELFPLPSFIYLYFLVVWFMFHVLSYWLRWLMASRGQGSQAELRWCIDWPAQPAAPPSQSLWIIISIPVQCRRINNSIMFILL